MLTEPRPDPAARLAGPTVFGPYSSTARACQARLRADARVRNDLLAAVSEETLARLRPLLERVDLKRKQVLYERNVPMPHAFFIERGAASVFSRSGDGVPSRSERSAGAISSASQSCSAPSARRTAAWSRCPARPFA
jgi:hypothetical protein